MHWNLFRKDVIGKKKTCIKISVFNFKKTSCLEVVYKNDILKHFAKLQEKKRTGASFFIKLQGLAFFISIL